MLKTDTEILTLFDFRRRQEKSWCKDAEEACKESRFLSAAEEGVGSVLRLLMRQDVSKCPLNFLTERL